MDRRRARSRSDGPPDTIATLGSRFRQFCLVGMNPRCSYVRARVEGSFPALKRSWAIC